MHNSGPIEPDWGHGLRQRYRPGTTDPESNHHWVRSIFPGSGGISKQMKRNKIMAILGAAALTLGVVGVAFAENLNSGQVGDKLSSFEQTCEGFPLEVGAGQIGVHFVLTTPDGDAT